MTGNKFLSRSMSEPSDSNFGKSQWQQNFVSCDEPRQPWHRWQRSNNAKDWLSDELRAQVFQQAPQHQVRISTTYYEKKDDGSATLQVDPVDMSRCMTSLDDVLTNQQLHYVLRYSTTQQLWVCVSSRGEVPAAGVPHSMKSKS